MLLPWFRLYHEFDSDPKVQMMPEVMQRRLLMLFCSRAKCETLHETERAFHWRIPMAELAETKALFIEKGFIDKQWDVLNWDRRQFISDNVTDRVRRHRRGLKQGETLQEVKGNVTGNGYVTNCNVRDTDTDTDTEKNKKAAPAKPALFVFPEWISGEVWADFEEMRRKKRAPLTDRARANIVASLIRFEARGQHADDVLNQSITNCWSGVFQIKEFEIGGRNGNGNRGQGRTNGNLEAARRAAEAITGQGSDGAGGGTPGGSERGNVEAVLSPSG